MNSGLPQYGDGEGEGEGDGVGEGDGRGGGLAEGDTGTKADWPTVIAEPGTAKVARLSSTCNVQCATCGTEMLSITFPLLNTRADSVGHAYF